MSDKSKEWFDLGYKIAVIVGSVAMIYANATFATKTDLQHFKDELKEDIGKVKNEIAITNGFGQANRSMIIRLEEITRDHEARIRFVENKRQP